MGASNSTVAHAWANGLSSPQKGSNLFYDYDGVIYSYGYHFPAAKRLAGGTYLVTTNSYSSSTQRHLSKIRSAIGYHGREVFNVPNVRATSVSEHQENYADYLDRLKSNAEYYHRARSSYRKDSLAESITTLISEANDYNAYFKLEYGVLREIDYFSDELAEQIKADALAARKKAAEDKKHAEAILADNIASWRRGETPYIREYGGGNSIGVKLRYNRENEMVETSLRAHFPAAEAERAWRVIQICRAKGIEWKANGEQVELGVYRLSRVYPDGRLIAGCHDVPYEESKYIAEQLGLAITVSPKEVSNG